MCLAGLDTPEEANPWLEGFRLQHNAKFAKAPAWEGDAHRLVDRSRDEWGLIFTRHHDRCLSGQAEFRFKNGHCQVIGEGKGYRLRNVPLQICEDFGGQVRVFAEGRELQIRRLASGPYASPAVHEKTLSGGSYSEATKVGEAQGSCGEPSVAGIDLHAVAGLGVAGRAGAEGESRRAGVVWRGQASFEFHSPLNSKLATIGHYYLGLKH